MLKIAICDDEIKEISSISSLISNYISEHDIPITYKCYTSSVELASKAAYEKYDRYLLDVIMPVLSGMSLAKEIRSFDKASDIIFLTSSPEFAVESYTVKAANYLLKPITKDNLFHALNDILEIKKADSPKYIVVKNTSGVHKLLLSNIVCVEAFNRKVIYHLNNNSQLECSERFTSICGKLMENHEFMLAHRSFAVNMNFVRSIGSTDMQLQNGKIIPLAQRRVSEIKKQYLAFQMEEMP